MLLATGGTTLPSADGVGEPKPAATAAMAGAIAGAVATAGVVETNGTRCAMCDL